MPPIAPPPEPADIGLVAATTIEVAPLLARLHHKRHYQAARQRVIEGELGGKLLAITLVGMGRARARRGANLLLDGHRPRWLISAGFAGALVPTLRRDDVLLADEVVDEAGTLYSLDLKLPVALVPGFHSARLLTVDRMILTAVEKAHLRDRHGASLVDMETSGVAEVCQQRSVRFLSVRVISDEAGVDLPREVLAIVGPSGGFRLGAAAGAIWKRPSSLKDLWALREHAASAAERLAEVLPSLLAQLT